MYVAHLVFSIKSHFKFPILPVIMAVSHHTRSNPRHQPRGLKFQRPTSAFYVVYTSICPTSIFWR